MSGSPGPGGFPGQPGIYSICIQFLEYIFAIIYVFLFIPGGKGLKGEPAFCGGGSKGQKGEPGRDGECSRIIMNECRQQSSVATRYHVFKISVVTQRILDAEVLLSDTRK